MRYHVAAIGGVDADLNEGIEIGFAFRHATNSVGCEFGIRHAALFRKSFDQGKCLCIDLCRNT